MKSAQAEVPLMTGFSSPVEALNILHNPLRIPSSTVLPGIQAPALALGSSLKPGISPQKTRSGQRALQIHIRKIEDARLAGAKASWSPSGEALAEATRLGEE